MSFVLPTRLAVLHNRNFRLYWLGQLVSLTGTWMQIVAQSWLVLQLTGSVAALGIINFVQALPMLVLSLTGGVAADRWDRRRIMLATQIGLMALAFALAALIVADLVTFPLLLAFAVLAGVAAAYDLPAQQALVPDLVRPDEVPQAVALNQVIFNGSRLIGPAVGGVLLVQFDLASVYLLNGVSFLAVIASLLLLRLPAGGARGGARGSMGQALREGLRFVWSQRLLRALMASIAVAVLLVFPALATLAPAYVKDALGRGPGTLSLLMAVSGGTSMLGALGMLWIPARQRGAVMVGCVVLTAAALFALGAWPALWPAVIATGLASVGFSLFQGLNVTTVQQLAPGPLRGRVMSVSSLMFIGVMPFAGLVVSFLIERYGFGPVFTLSAVAYALIGLSVLLPSGILGFVPPAQPAAGPPGHGMAPAGPPHAEREEARAS